MTDTSTAPDDTSAYFGPITRKGAEAGEAFQDKIPTIDTPEAASALKPGTQFKDPTGNIRVVPYRASRPEDAYSDDIPEGADFVDPEGNLRTKPKYEPIDFTAQTLYDMSVNDKERRKALERSYPGKVKETPTGELYVEDEGGKMRKPGHGAQASAGFLTAQAAPVLGSAFGTVVGGGGGSVVPGPGTVAGGVAGAAAGSATGQAFNDAILWATGVYDRSAGEEAGNLALAGAFGGGGELAGAAIGAAGGLKSVAQRALPKVAAKFTGANVADMGEGLALAEEGEHPSSSRILRTLGMTDPGVSVRPSAIYPGAPHAQNISEVFEPAFETKGGGPIEESVASRYEQKAKGVLEGAGVKPPESVLDKTASVSTREAGQALISRALKEAQAASAELEAKQAEHMALTQMGHVKTQEAFDTSNAAVQKAAAKQRETAEKLFQSVFSDIRNDAREAQRVAGAGGNSGDLWWTVGEKLKASRTAVVEQHSKWYDEVDATTKGLIPNSRDVPEAAAQFLEQVPQGFEGQYPKFVQQLRDMAGIPKKDAEGNIIPGEWEKPPLKPSLPQLHKLRSFARHNVNWNALSHDFEDGTWKYFSKVLDGAIHDADAIPELKAAAQRLDAIDKSYGENIRVFNAEELNAVIAGLKSGQPADAKKLYDVLFKNERPDLTREIQKIIGPTLSAAVAAADREAMLDFSRTLAQDGQIDAKKWAGEVLKRYQMRGNMLEAVHGKDASEKMIETARSIYMLDGELPITARPGDPLRTVVAKAKEAKEAAEEMAKKNPLAALQQETRKIEQAHRRETSQLGKQQRADPLAFLRQPSYGADRAVNTILKSEDLAFAAVDRFGRDSPEFKMLQQIWVQRLLQKGPKPGEELAKVSEEMQHLMMPGVTYEQAKTLAKNMDFLLGTKRGGDMGMAGGMSAMSKIEHPISALAGISGPVAGVLDAPAKIIPGVSAGARAALGGYFTLIRKLLESPSTMRFIMKGLKGDEEAKKLAQDAARRLMQKSAVAGAALGESFRQTPTAPGTSPIPAGSGGQEASPFDPKRNIIGDFFGSLWPAEPNEVSAKNPEYPTDEDAAFAQKSGYAYGKPWEDYFNNEKIRVLGTEKKEGYTPASAAGLDEDDVLKALDSPNVSKVINLKDPKNSAIRDVVQNQFAKAALATGRNALAQLGFNPNRTLMDIVTRTANIGGVTSGDTSKATSPEDRMYVNETMGSGATIVHESIHNGIKKVLAANPDLKAEMDKLPGDPDEAFVRHIMETEMGDVEKGRGEAGDKQIKSSDWWFKNEPGYQKFYDKLRKKAEDMIGRKLGPH